MRLDLNRLRTADPRSLPSEDAESAAVLVPVVERPSGHAILFTERSPDLSQHAGEMSFPGGGREPADPDLETTALRETHEEVGINPTDVDVVGRLDDVPGPYGHVVRPFVGRIPDREYAPASSEVAAVVVLPAEKLANPENFRREERSHPERGTAVLPFFEVNGHTVWGLTGFILQSLFERTADWRA